METWQAFLLLMVSINTIVNCLRLYVEVRKSQ